MNFNTIYILSPAHVKTGGTELLHQLVYHLKLLNLNATIVYFDANSIKNINPSFTQYVESYLNLEDIDDSINNILIVPEISTQYLRLYKHINKAIWWLSVDNYLKDISVKYRLKSVSLLSGIKLLIKKTLGKNINYLSLKEIKKIEYHFVQSNYARIYLQNNSISSKYLTDYLNEIYLTSNVDLEEKQNIVLYNPKKGATFTQKIIRKNPSIKFIPLINMSNSEIISNLKIAKVYIDFGNHPGKDRFPREAAMMHCCIITSLDGSALNNEDISIHKSYKFIKKTCNIKSISKMINNCLISYDKHIINFKSYREKISNEKSVFIDQTKKIFLKENEQNV
jgi:hypothetical protein